MTQASSELVLDASVAVKWYLVDEANSQLALSVSRAFTSGRVRLFAPDHIRYELGSALRVASRTRPPRLSEADAEANLVDFAQLGVRMVNDPALILEAFRVAGVTGCAFYDGLYVALAQRLGIPLITADRKLYDRIRGLPAALWIGDWQPG